ncbi:hypothetical protein [Bifidobacterium sp. SO1]|uniref:Lar family restriction alleviation protein n=1 Tax=Bifidobacterium sp. SO1 TaxID=2809029 RepID=UPI001BDC51BE|nr:hypothetical protein [Bifidobacterium sp. SO1]MBT1162898.1 hypothetical protein [Bifidobacterium sp. SO1]
MSEKLAVDDTIQEWWRGQRADELNSIQANVLYCDSRYSGVLTFHSNARELCLETTEISLRLGRVSETGLIKPGTYLGGDIPVVRMIGLPDAVFWHGRFLEELIGVKVTAMIRNIRRHGVLALHDDQLTLGKDRTPVFLRDRHGFAQLENDVADIRWNARHGNGFHSFKTGFAMRDRDHNPIRIEYGSLKPCPFCGGNDLAMEPVEPDWFDDGDDEETSRYQVRCSCGIEVAGTEYEGAGVTATRRAARSAAYRWNRRAA